MPQSLFLDSNLIFVCCTCSHHHIQGKDHLSTNLIVKKLIIMQDTCYCFLDRKKIHLVLIQQMSMATSGMTCSCTCHTLWLINLQSPSSDFMLCITWHTVRSKIGMLRNWWLYFDIENVIFGRKTNMKFIWTYKHLTTVDIKKTVPTRRHVMSFLRNI